MVEVDLRKDYMEYCQKFRKVWALLQQESRPFKDVISDLCDKRLYFDSFDRWSILFREVGIAYVTGDFDILKNPDFYDLGLFSKEGKFLLRERFIIPVRDILGNIIALIGWYPDNKRYITTPSKYFSKEALFFGMDQLGAGGLFKPAFVVEGIFDSLALRSFGFRAYAHMGVSGSKYKLAMYGLFGSITAIPDNDDTGRSVLLKDGWQIPVSGRYLRWKGVLDGNIRIKDIDDFCNLFEEDSVKGELKRVRKSVERVACINI